MLTRIIVASHGKLARALAHTVELIAGAQEEIHCLGIAPGDDISAFATQLVALVDVAKPCLILVDMPGGTPWNVAMEHFGQNEAVRVVSGVNLPMLLEVTLGRNDMSIDAWAELARTTGIESIRVGKSLH